MQIRASTQARHAKTRSDRNAASLERELLRCDLFAETLDCQPHAILLGMGCDQQEFVAADPAAHVALPGIGLEDFGELLENGIAGIASLRVVYRLELV